MTANAEARLAEARDNVWLGEVPALEKATPTCDDAAQKPTVKSLTAPDSRTARLRC